MTVITSKIYGQLDHDILSINYAVAPKGNDDLDFSKTDIKINLPTMFRKGILSNSLSINYYEMNFENALNFNTKDLENVYDFNYTLSYAYPIYEKWELEWNAGVSLISNLTNNITSEDFLFNGGVIAVKNGGTIDNPSKLKFGLTYSTITGIPRILPHFSFAKYVNSKFNYSLGFPMSYATFHLNNRSILNSVFWVDGFYSNLSNPVYINYSDSAQKTSFSSLTLGLDYNYKMDESWSIIFKAGYSLTNKYEILDQENNLIYDFETATKPFFSTGIRFDLKNKFNKNMIK